MAPDRRAWWVPAVVVLVGACGATGVQPHVRVEVDRSEYVRDSVFSPITIVATVHNDGEAVAILRGCEDRLNWDFQRLVEGAWIVRADGNFGCAPPTPGRLDLSAGQGHTDTVSSSLQPGAYRLAVFYQASAALAEPFVVSSPSSRFVVR